MSAMHPQKLDRIELLAVIALVTQVFIFAPLKFYLGQFYAFDFALWQPPIFTLVIACAAGAVCYGVLAFAHGTVRRILLALVAGLALWSWIKSSVLIWKYPVFEGAAVVWGQFVKEGRTDIVVLILCLAIPLLFTKALRRWLPLVFRISLIASIGYLAFEAFAMKQHYSTEVLSQVASVKELPRTTQLISSKKNVVVIIIDTVQADLFGELIAREPAVRTQLAGFTWFRDTASMSPITGTSVPSILTGKFDDNHVTYLQYLHDAYKQPGGILKLFGDHGYHTELVRWGMATPVPQEGGLAANQVATLTPDPDEMVRLFVTTGYGLLPQFLKMVALEPAADLALDEQLHGNSDPNRKFADQLERLPVAMTDEPVVKVFHLKGIHIPLERDEFADHPAEPPTYNRENVGQSMHWIFGELDTYLNQLRAAGQYDSSLIVILGDHGAGRMNIALMPQSLDPAYANSPLAKMQAAASPLLLVHRPNDTGPMAIDDAPVQLVDVPCTLQKLMIDDHAGCKSLFDWKVGDVRARPFFWLDSLHMTPYGSLLPMRAFMINGPVRDPHSWTGLGTQYTATGIEAEPRPTYSFGTDVVFGKRSNSAGYLEFGWRPSIESHFTWTDGHLAKFSMPTAPTSDAVRLDMQVQAAIEPGAPDHQRMILEANDHDLGTIALNDPNAVTVTRVFPAGSLSGGQFNLWIGTPDAEDPVKMDRGAGDMAIGVALHGLRLTPIAAVALGQPIPFGIGLPSQHYLLEGWKPPEQGFVWSAAPEARLILPLAPSASGWRVAVNLVPLLAPGKRDSQTVKVMTGSTTLATWTLVKPGSNTFDLSPAQAPGGVANLVFAFEDTRTPAALGISSDTTPLGAQLTKIQVTALP